MNIEIIEQVDKIMAYSSVKADDKIDRLLKINAIQYANLGSDSYKYEREQAEITSRYIYRCIKEVDKDAKLERNKYLGKMLLKYREE